MNVTDLFESRPDEAELVLPLISHGMSRPTPVVLNEEHTLTLYSAAAPLHRFVCSPCQLGELCAGWLFSEGYCAQSVEVSRDGHTAVALAVTPLPSPPEKLCLSGGINATPSEMLELFHAASDKYSRSHGIHECVIKGNGWHILRTDIGRHNAIDKAVGAAVLAGYDLHGATLFSSGRINVQTVRKAVRCGIGCLMSKATITHEALVLAENVGLPVFFCVKQDSYIQHAI